MSRTRKRLLLAAVGGLIVGCGWFYYFYFMSTDAAIRHAEAFLFRRMAVTNIGQQGEFRHFFVTNRAQDQGDIPLEQSFGSDREATLKFGSFDTSIEPSTGLGMVINPTHWFQNEEIQLNDIRQMEKDTFVERMRYFVDRSPGRSLLIVIHGFREGYSSALRKTAFVASVLDINTPVLLFDWPGDQGSSLRGYRQARTVAEASGAELARTLKIVIREVQPDRVSVLANSMGGQVVVDAFSLLYQDREFSDEEVELDHVVLTAPDVDHADFNATFKDEIQAMANNLTVYVSSNDRALLISRIINRGMRVGESTLSPDQLDEAVSVSRLVDADSNLITLIDVTPVNRTRNFHNFSLETPEFFDDLFIRLTAEEVAPLNRRIYAVRSPENAVYWVLTRGR